MSQIPITPAFLRSHIYWPLAAFLVVLLTIEVGGLDLKLADLIYSVSGNSWSLRSAWITNDLIHEGGRNLVGIGALLLLGLWLSSCFLARLKPWRKGWLFILVTACLAALSINILKRLTHTDCPWDLLRYGGSEPYVELFSALPSGKEPGACFPAGHASAGWSWFALYYWAMEYADRWRKPMLFAVLLAGFVFGASQQLRGAHFISHDLWTVALCWFLTTGLYLGFFHSPYLEEP